MRRIFLICMLLGAACDLSAQGNATFHVFPQFADGITAGGQAGYISNLLVTNASDQTSQCTVQLYGSGLANRLPGAASFMLQGSGSFTFLTSILGNGSTSPLATGYITLTCSQPVAASVIYAYAVAPFKIVSAATVFSSPPATRAQLFPLPGGRLAFALANNTDASAQYRVAGLDAAGQVFVSRLLTVPARSNVAKYIDEVLPPSPPNLAFAVTVTSLGSEPFSLLGLIFLGDLFTSQPAAILAQ